jgi:hypothetical protein
LKNLRKIFRPEVGHGNSAHDPDSFLNRLIFDFGHIDCDSNLFFSIFSGKNHLKNLIICPTYPPQTFFKKPILIAYEKTFTLPISKTKESS